ncbi:MAG: divalent metal cation transporter [Patescibacteria group bacterium]|nr:divalent metal cation transporter [Patescibacteria group bacterium]
MFKKRLKPLSEKIGPGIITGIADDDPSGVLTYIQSGLVLGPSSFWLAPFMLPMMYAIQEISGRLGLKSGKGLMSLIKENYHPAVFGSIAVASSIVIIINIGADLLAMSIILESLFRVSRLIWLPVVATLITSGMIFLSYKRFAEIMKWLALSLVFYILAVFYMHVQWLPTLKATILPSMSFNPGTLMLIAAVLGTSISPYLFFWQSGEEVEEKEEKTEERQKKYIITSRRIRDLREDTFIGMLFSEIGAWFMLIGGSQLFRLYHIKQISDFNQIALVLKPALGEAAYLIFSLGILGVGAIAIPTLAGSVGYMVAEVFKWKEGMNKRFKEASRFYLVIIIAMLAGLALNVLRLNPISLLIYTAVLYTIITPPIIYILIKLARNKKIVGNKTTTPLVHYIGIATLIIMAASAIGYLFTL